MAGFFGFAGPPRVQGSPATGSAFDDPLAAEPASRVSGSPPVWTFGTRDVDLALERDAALAVAGHARRGAIVLGARALLAMWRAKGAEALLELDGEHSIAVTLGGRTWVARDRYGTRPLYVGEVSGDVVFSTAIAPLLRAGVSAETHRSAVVRSLVLGYVPAPDTALAGIEQVPPGEVWTLSPTRARVRWYAPRERLDVHRSLPATARVLDRAVTRAVRRALPPSGRIGAFLSGGLDSSLVLARVHEEGRNVEAFTLHFGDTLPSELRYAEGVARHLGVRHHVMTLDARAFVAGLEPALAQLEDSLTEPIAVPNFLLAAQAARSCDVLFTGEGGDPTFGGPKNVGMVLAVMYGHGPSAPSLAQAYMTAHHHLADDLDVGLTPEWRASLDLPEFERSLTREIEGRTRRGHATTFVGALMRANVLLKGGSNILVKVAKMVGAHDVALRSPLFDRGVVELALTIPPWQKLAGTDEKMVLKRAALRSLPQWVVERPKRGMAVPLRAWLSGALGELARDTLTRRAVRERGLFRWEYVSRLLKLDRMPSDLARSRSAEKLWLVLVTELHLRSIARLATGRRAA